MPEQNQQYLNKEGLTALWEKIRNRDAQLSASISAVQTAVSSTVPNLSVSGIGGVSGTLGLSAGGLGVTAWDAARDAQHLDVYTRGEVDSLFSADVVIKTESEWESYQPTSADLHTIFYVGPIADVSGVDKYDEYIVHQNGSSFEKLRVGEHSIDLSDYINTISLTGSGNAVTTTAKSGNTLTLGKDQTFVLSSDYTATIGDIESDIQYLSGAVSSLEEQGDEFTEAIESLNNRMTSAETDISGLDTALDLLNGRIENLEDFQEEVTDAFTAMNMTFTSNPWETITAVTSVSGKLSIATATIPSIPLTAIEHLNDSWTPANGGEGE
jgi:hypothetical protein